MATTNVCNSGADDDLVMTLEIITEVIACTCYMDINVQRPVGAQQEQSLKFLILPHIHTSSSTGSSCLKVR